MYLTLSIFFSIELQWLPSGDAFRISDLHRLENETLPTFFRHRRFQSLVRQLNFYNFRKVNRERTFWVYRHQLFHRDKPEELHLLRRRTCPGVDGRKQRSDNSDSFPSRSNSPRPPTGRRIPFSPADDQSDASAASLPLNKNKRKLRSGEELEMKRNRRKANSESEKTQFESENEDEESHDQPTELSSFAMQESPSSRIDVNLLSHVVPDEGDDIKGPNGLPKRMVSPSIFGAVEKRDRSNSLEQSLLVSKVARKLEEHAKRAAKGGGSSRRSGTVTPPYSSDTMKYHALTYDDEIEIYDSERGCVVERQQRVTQTNDSDENASVISNYDEEGPKVIGKPRVTFTGLNKDSSMPPVADNVIVSNIVRKLHGFAQQTSFISRVDGQLAAAIAGFCMLTNPRDTMFEDKCVELLFKCGSLVTEFRQYKAALLPGSLPPESLVLKQTSRLDVQIKQLFDGDKINTIRVFKVFVLNNLEDIVNDKSLMSKVGLSVSEADCMNDCYKIWLTCLRHSS